MTENRLVDRARPHRGEGRTPPPPAEAALRRIFRRALDAHRMIAPGDRVVAAVSGGADSTALLDLLAAEAGARKFALAVAHLDHRLRGEASREDRRFVEERAAALGLPCFSGEEDVAGLARREHRSIEDAGRLARERFFDTIARRFDAGRLATGHHRDDLAEGVLMRILQGAGVSGLAAIRPVTVRHTEPTRPLTIIRPLLDASRHDILAYLEARGLPFRTDETNADSSHLRNRVRNRLIPYLQREFNPSISEALVRTAGILREEDEHLGQVVADWLERFRTDAPGRGVELPLRALRDLPAALRRRAVRDSLVRAGASPRRIRFDQIDTLDSLLDRGRTGTTVRFAGGFEASLQRHALRIAPVPPAPRAGVQPVRVRVPGCTRLEPAVGDAGAGLYLEASVLSAADRSVSLRSGGGDEAHVDYDRAGPSLSVRRPRAGDRFRPLGAPGRRKISDALIDAGVPRPARSGLPVVTGRSPEGAETIVWVAALRIAEEYKVTGATRQVLHLRIRRGESS